MADPTSPTGWLDALSWGASTGGALGSAESSTTIGLPRIDTRVPPTQYNCAGLQQARLRDLALAMSTYFRGGTRLQSLVQSANPFAVGEMGFYASGTAAPGSPVFMNGTTAMNLQQAGPLQALSFSASQTYNFNVGGVILMTLTANVTAATMTAGTYAGQEGKLILTQDGTGSRTHNVPANVKVAAGAFAASGANKVDAYSFVWNSSTSFWQEVGRAANC